MSGPTGSCATRRHLTGRVEGPACGLSQRAAEAEGSLTPEARGRVGAALTTTGRVGTARRPGSGKRDEKVQRAVNQWWNPRKRETPAPTWWMWAGQQRAIAREPGGRLHGGVIPGVVEAIRKACGVLVARLPGKSWAPPSSTGRW
jgi:hypothetical protein